MLEGTRFPEMLVQRGSGWREAGRAPPRVCLACLQLLSPPGWLPAGFLGAPVRLLSVSSRACLSALPAFAFLSRCTEGEVGRLPLVPPLLLSGRAVLEGHMNLPTVSTAGCASVEVGGIPG